MSATVRLARQTFTPEQVGEVIGLATELERPPTDESLTYGQLVDVARELGISPAAVAEAVGLWDEKRRRRARESVRSLKRRVRHHRRLRRFYRHLAVYLTVVIGLALLDWASGPGWWVEWIIFGWGILVGLQGVRLMTARYGPLDRFLTRRDLAT
jgi:hypothetical protein